MSDYRLVQCFGTKKQQHKPDKACKKRWLWTAQGANKYRFGGNGTSVCPNCGTPADFRHPFNKYLNNELTEEQAKSRMSEYIKFLENEKSS